MNTIEIRYRPFPLLPFQRNINRLFPDKWSEISAAQIIALSAARHDKIDDLDFIHSFTGISRKILKKLSEFHLWNITRCFEWMNTIQPHNRFVIGEIKSGNNILKAPLPRLKKVLFSQFIFADTCFADYLESDSDSDLNRFVCSWYVPEGLEFTEDIMEKSAVGMAKVDLHIREAVVLNYLLIRQWLYEVYPLVFVQSHDDDKQKGPEPKKMKSNTNGWIRIFEQIVGDDIVNSDRYATLPLHNVLRFLSQRIKDNMKRK